MEVLVVTVEQLAMQVIQVTTVLLALAVQAAVAATQGILATTVLLALAGRLVLETQETQVLRA
jgi:hypothetical protein